MASDLDASVCLTDVANVVVNFKSGRCGTVDECLAYFRQAISTPLSVPPWSEWWALNSDLVRQVFSRFDYLRLKYRRLRAAREVLQDIGALPSDFRPASPLISGCCDECGERVIIKGGPGGGAIECPVCGLLSVYDTTIAFRH